MTLKLGIPSKGRLMADTFDWFAARGVTITRTGTDREYAGRVDGVDGVELVLLAAGEIPREWVFHPPCGHFLHRAERLFETIARHTDRVGKGGH